MEWRDKAMLENLLWLAHEVYPNEKFIVWAHNDHIRKAHSKVMGSPYPVKMLGELLPEEEKKLSYVIRLYMGGGELSTNDRMVLPVSPLEKGSIEDILSAVNTAYTFIDMRYCQNERGNSWMFEPRLAYSWGIIPESFVPREQYDVLLLIDQASPPTYIE
nr:erythromycin esterase family protein [Metasolibacillus meyeri]